MNRPFGFSGHAPKYAVFGNPVFHSKSPRIHRQFAKQTGVDLEYRAIEAPLRGFRETLQTFMAAGGKGLNVTLPFKIEAYQAATELSPRAQLAAAVNTLRIDGPGKLYGDNTDGAGLLRDIEKNCRHPVRDRHVLILGAGGAVRGILQPLISAGPASLWIINRTAEKAIRLAGQFSKLLAMPIEAGGFADLPESAFDIIINATAASLHGDNLHLPGTLARGESLAYDLVYADQDTPFMSWAREVSVEAVSDGLGMLVEQAAESFLLWHGVRPATGEVIARLRGK